MSIGLAIIALNEEKTIPRLLASIEGAFDRVVLLDTGSRDETVKVFQGWAATQGEMTYSTARFKWVNDFSAARRAADNLLMWGQVDSSEGAPSLVDWTCWADCDDVIVNARNLRQIAANAPVEVGMLIFGYDYAQNPATGQSICHLRRERLVRPNHGLWTGRVHEAQLANEKYQFMMQQVPDELCHWKHVKQADGIEAAQRSNSRNLKILRAWAKDEPTNPRVLAYLGNEELVRGNPSKSLSWFRKYWPTDDGWVQHRAQVCRKAATACMALAMAEGVSPSESKRWFGAAQMWSMRGFETDPTWSDNELSMGQLASIDGRHDVAIHFAQRVLDAGMPETMLIISPLDYTFEPLKMIAVSHSFKGDFDKAVQFGQQALALNPIDEMLQRAVFAWRENMKVEHTVSTAVMFAQSLVNHDEQAKALIFLEQCVPHFATDQPRVVQMRSMVRERLLWTHEIASFNEHYIDGGSKPEDFPDDETAAGFAMNLPRVGFLLSGLVEQGAQAKITIEEE